LKEIYINEDKLKVLNDAPLLNNNKYTIKRRTGRKEFSILHHYYKNTIKEEHILFFIKVTNK
jgi:hypothetical protein